MTAPLQDDENITGNTPLQVLLLSLITVVPLFILILLYVTSLNVTLGRALGVNLPSSDQLVIYDVLCDSTALNPILYITYWSADSAPLVISFDNFESPIINSPAGIHSIDLTLRAEDTTCPQAVILTDRSRARRAGGSVEIREE